MIPDKFERFRTYSFDVIATLVSFIRRPAASWIVINFTCDPRIVCGVLSGRML